MSLGEIKSDMEVNPGVYTEWFKIILCAVKKDRIVRI